MGETSESNVMLKPLFMDEVFESLPNTATVLDLGCGNGSFDYSNYKFSIKAVDVAEPSKPMPPNAEFKKCDVISLPFEANTFDVVIANWILEHVAEPEKVLAEVGRVLKDDGLFYVSIPDGSGFDDKLYRWLYNGGGHLNKFKFEGFRALAGKSAGLTLVAYSDWYSGFTYLRTPSQEARIYLKETLMRVTYLLPNIIVNAVQQSVIWFARNSDKKIGTHLSRCGWILLYKKTERTETPEKRSVPFNVCRKCGASYRGSPQHGVMPFLRTFKCPGCGTANLFV